MRAKGEEGARSQEPGVFRRGHCFIYEKHLVKLSVFITPGS
jgi:hypothetical protein